MNRKTFSVRKRQPSPTTAYRELEVWTVWLALAQPTRERKLFQRGPAAAARSFHPIMSQS